MHGNYYNKHNVEVPSVTTVLKIINKEGLVEWSNMLGKRGLDYKTTLEQYATRGTKIHNDIESVLLTGEPTQKAFRTKDDDEIDLVVNKFKATVKELHFSNVKTEIPLSCDTYGGTLDLLCDITLNGKRCKLLGDFKTSKKIYPNQFIQLGGYLNLIKINDIDLYNQIDCCGIINVKKDKITIQYISKEACETIFTDIFLTTLALYRKLITMDHIEFNINTY